MTLTRSRTPFLIAFAGVVGSGKTHIAGMLARRLRAIHINTDAIRVKLRRRGESMTGAIRIAEEAVRRALRAGRSVVADFDAVRPAKQHELAVAARRFGARFFLIRVDTPEHSILARLRRKRYTPSDLFKDSAEAIRVYRIRKAFRRRFRGKRSVRSFAVDNAKPLGPQIANIVKKLEARQWRGAECFSRSLHSRETFAGR